jgi:hypothetical protein
MCAWRVDPVNGRGRLVKDIARQYAASDREITRAFGRISGSFFFPSPLAYKDLDAYVAAWRDAIVKALRAYRATSDRLFGTGPPPRRAVLSQAEWRKGRQEAPQGARAPRAWRRNAERMERNWTRSL